MILAWIELIYLLFKATLLSAIYASLLLIVMYTCILLTKWEYAFTQRFIIFVWLLMGFVIFISLFTYRFSYWQDMGMGETVQVPVGYGQVVYNADGFMTYFDMNPNQEEYLQEDHMHIGKYIVDNKMICAETEDEMHDPEFRYLIFDMASKTLKRFTTAKEYDAYATAHQLPEREKFKDFTIHYNIYYNKEPKWKRWLLL